MARGIIPEHLKFSRMNRLLLIISLLTFSLVGGAQSTKTATLIRQLEQEVTQAILRHDTVRLKNLWAPEFMVNNPRNNISQNRRAVFQAMQEGLITYTRFERTIEQLQIRKNTAISMGQETFVSQHAIPGILAGKPYQRRFTNIWLRKNGRWQQVARHASIICG
jgi:hypothetical protein